MKIKRNSFKAIVFVFAMAVFLSACSSVQLFEQFIKGSSWGASGSAGKGAYKIGNPYKVFGTWYYPKESFDYVETGTASWYGPGFHADSTANGEVYNQNKLTAAHKTLQMPCFVRVTNLENGRTVIVKINDRGPFKKGRIIDLSKRAAELLDFANKGTARVKIKVMPEASRYIAAIAKRGEDTSQMDYDDVRDLISDGRDNSEQPVKVAFNDKKTSVVMPVSAENEIRSDVPESLMTPTITVEALQEDSNPMNRVQYKENSAAIINYNNKNKDKNSVAVTQKTVKNKTTPVYSKAASKTDLGEAKTGIFVQAGTFKVSDNAYQLANDLKDLGSVNVGVITTSKGTEMYRVKLGPIANMAEAKRILNEVKRRGMNTAWLIR